MNEIYEFSFKRGQLIKVMGGVLSLVVLVFCAGLLVGVAIEFREPMPTLVAQSTPLSPQPVAVAVPAVSVDPPAVDAAQEETAAAPGDADDEETAIDPDKPAVEDPAVSAPTAEPAESGIPGRFAVQLGAFLQPHNAEILSKKLLAKGYDADVVVREDSHGRMWYLVRYGIFQNRTEATAIALEFKSRENLDALVRPSNSM